MTGLHGSQYMPDLLLTALERNGDRDRFRMGDRAWSAREVRDGISRYVRACRSLGIDPQIASATPSKSRPELLMAIGAYMLLPLRNTPLHPLGSFDDHAFVIADAGIEVLVFDPASSERAAQLAAALPQLRYLLSLCPSDVGIDIVALAATFEPMPLAAAALDPEATPALGYTGGPTGRPKGVMSTYRSVAFMAHLMTDTWQWPEEVRHLVCTPLSHGGGAFFVPVLRAVAPSRCCRSSSRVRCSRRSSGTGSRR